MTPMHRVGPVRWELYRERGRQLIAPVYLGKSGRRRFTLRFGRMTKSQIDRIRRGWAPRPGSNVRVTSILIPLVPAVLRLQVQRKAPWQR